MTDIKEIEQLKSEAEKIGGKVDIATEGNGNLQVSVSGVKGIGPYPMPPIMASERIREALNLGW